MQFNTFHILSSHTKFADFLLDSKIHLPLFGLSILKKQGSLLQSSNYPNVVPLSLFKRLPFVPRPSQEGHERGFSFLRPRRQQQSSVTCSRAWGQIWFEQRVPYGRLIFHCSLKTKPPPKQEPL